jgi:predicted amidohydrolase YtcJ
MQIGHNRQEVGANPESEVLPPIEDRIRRDELVNGYTSNAAYQLGREGDLGRIAVGYQADLVVLNQNLFEVDRHRISETKPLTVIMDGAVVHGQQL